jgi:hypothetical protein
MNEERDKKLTSPKPADDLSSLIDEKLNIQLTTRPGGQFKEQKSRDITDIKRELARKDDKLVKMYLKGLHDTPAVMPEDRMTRQVLEYAIGNQEAREARKMVDVITPGRAQFIVDATYEKMAFDRSVRKHGPTIPYLMKGKLGVDAYLILFAVVGLVSIPAYFYRKQQKVLKYMKDNEISPISVEDLANKEYKDIDLDDISKHVTYYDQETFKKELKSKMKIAEEKHKLREDLYGPSERAKEKFLFGRKTTAEKLMEYKERISQSSAK